MKCPSFLAGPDGKLSIRKGMGLIAFGVSLWLSILGTIKFTNTMPENVSWPLLAGVYGGAVLTLACSLFLFRFITTQNIKEFVAKKE